MTVKEYMTRLAAAGGAAATGEYTGRDMVLGIQTDSTQTTPDAYTYVGAHIEDYGAELDTTTEDKSYIFEGDYTVKTGVRRIFSLSGQMYLSDAFMDYINSFAVKYGIGSAVQAGYCYFHAGTKKGEQGTMSVIVNKDGSGAAGDPADIDVDLKSSGVVSEYTYTG